VLGPGAVISVLPVTARLLTGEEVSHVKDGSGAIYVWGRLEYEDAFSAKHFVTYRLIYGGNAGARSDGLMMPTEGDNDNDAD
jgi:hypothetical protein